MTFVAGRPFADPKIAARKLLQLRRAGAGRSHPHREDQLAVPVRVQGQAGRIRRRPQARNRARMALAARERDIRAHN